MKVPSKHIKKIPPATFPKDAITVSVSQAAALFNMSDEWFIRRYVRTRDVRFNALHQLNMRDVLRVYSTIPKEFSETTRYDQT